MSAAQERQTERTRELPRSAPSLKPDASFVWHFISGSHRARLILEFWRGCPPEWRGPRPVVKVTKVKRKKRAQ